MERHVRYEVLQNQEEPEPAMMEPVALDMVAPPTPEPEAMQAMLEGTDEEAFWSKVSGKEPPVPPSYSVATTLPSYEEAEKSKQEEIEQMEKAQTGDPETRDRAVREIDRFADMQLGTDGMFLCMFIIAFLFNWVGLLASLCITHTVAGRFGAIAGFGLSMVKWVAILKHNNWAAGLADGDSWLWWLLIILGFLIFFRGCTQYIRIKYQWHRLSSHLRNRIYLLF
jgi:hypothetical protein